MRTPKLLTFIAQTKTKLSYDYTRKWDPANRRIMTPYIYVTNLKMKH